MHVAHKTCGKATPQVAKLSARAFIFRQISHVSLMDFHSEARTKTWMWLGRPVLMQKNDRKKRREEYALCGVFRVPRSTFTLKASGKQELIENAQRAWKAVCTCQPETLNGNHSDRSSDIRVQTTSCHKSQPCHYNLPSLTAHPQFPAACQCKACFIALVTHIFNMFAFDLTSWTSWGSVSLELQWVFHHLLFFCLCLFLFI